MRIEPLDDAPQLSLTTFEDDGTARRSPARFAGSGGRFVVLLDTEAPEVARIRTNPRVEIAAGDRSGDVLPGAAILAGTARVLDGIAEQAALDQIRRKDGLSGRAAALGGALWHRARGTEASPRVVVEVVLTEAV
ncbi:MAG: pyridoxamine 5'-phosphate oxidase family protein [Actinomycetota bacterium]